MNTDFLDQIISALDAGTRCFIIRGAAGTGKTTLVRTLIPLLHERGFGVQLMAPTGRAALILNERTGHSAKTIHATIYDSAAKPIVNDQDDVLKWVFPLKMNVDVEDIAFIADESSMVGLAKHDNDREIFQFGSGSLLEDLIHYSGIKTDKTTNLLFFVGDMFQLPPVGEKCETPPALNEDTLEKLTGFKPKVIELSTIHRQKKEVEFFKKPLGCGMRCRPTIIIFSLFRSMMM